MDDETAGIHQAKIAAPHQVGGYRRVVGWYRQRAMQPGQTTPSQKRRPAARLLLVVVGPLAGGAVVALAGFLFGGRLFSALVALLVLYAALLIVPRARAGCALAAANSATAWGVVLAVSSSAAMVCLTVLAGRAGLDTPPAAGPEALVTALAAVGYIGPVGLVALLVLVLGWPGGTRSAAAVGYAELAALVVACVAAAIAAGGVAMYWLFDWLRG